MAAAMRAFIAVELPSAIIRQAETIQLALQCAGLRLRWVRPYDIHLTIRFLGAIDPQALPRVARAMQAAVEDHPAITVAVEGLGLFPGRRNPRVLWLGVGGGVEKLGILQQRLETALARNNFPKEPRPFKAHLTLARIKAPVDAGRLLSSIEVHRSYAPLEFKIEELVLFKSDLRPQGALYTPLTRVALAG